MAWQSTLDTPAALPQPAQSAPAIEQPALDLLNGKDMAAWLGMHENTFRLAVKNGHLPAGAEYGAGPRWSKMAMFAFVYGKVQEQVQAQATK